MKNLCNQRITKKIALFAFGFSLLFSVGFAQTTVTDFKKINSTSVEVSFSDNRKFIFDFYGENIFRLFCDPSGGAMRNPEAKPAADILVANPKKNIVELIVNERNGIVSINTQALKIDIDKQSSQFRVFSIPQNAMILETAAPILFERSKVTLAFKTSASDYFYGGGVQNGRFSHKGKIIAIENQNSWTDGGVASPAPFFWSTGGYALMWHTFKKGRYDFGATEKDIVKLWHETDYLDVFLMFDNGAIALLNDYYQLTGNPVLLPKFGFYEGHLNAYNRDYWKADSTGILFEDGKRYKESQKDNGGVRESLNGEKNNYQFSARAVIDRYKNHDMPLGWLLPNDGYGAGYGQTETLDGNIQNLKSLAEYSHSKGVEIGLWTQSDLHPKPEISALLQRDIEKEVRDAGVRVLKTDVAWVGAGYSFGLNGIADVASIMTNYGNNSRPFIISLDGWAGTQRYAGIWSGDQTGGVWEYIRFHIPTYIGSGLSGIPNISSDMDGIFGGKNPVVNIRDFQWKTFTPMQLNMDGWGANEKYPHALGEPAASVNRLYLKLKSELIPYTYSIAKEAVDGLPMIRAMFLEYPNQYTLGTSTQYQFMYGHWFLVAPIYQASQIDAEGNDVRNSIYLPEGEWIDYFSGDLYEGGRIINNFSAPIWKLPVFVKRGAIIPMNNPNNNVGEIDLNRRIYEFYPYQKSAFTEYDDDGRTEAYKAGESAVTIIESSLDAKGNVQIKIHPTQGNFAGFVQNKATELKINVTKKPAKPTVKIGNKTLKLREAASIDDYLQSENVFYYDAAPNLNRFATKGSEFEKTHIVKNPLLLVKIATTNITKSAIILNIKEFEYKPSDKLRTHSGSLASPKNAVVSDANIQAYTLKPTWDKVHNADYYEIDFNGMLYSTIRDNELIFEGLTPETTYLFKIRSVNRDGVSDWAEFSATTKPNPLEFAIPNIAGNCTVKSQGGSGIARLFNFDEMDMWHTQWDTVAVPFDLILDLKTFNQLDKFQYLPRISGVNGIITKGSVYFGSDNENWQKAGDFDWKRNAETKTFDFQEHPTARYLKISVAEAAGNFGSGREIYVFKVAGTESYLAGDVNNDGQIDFNDLTSYMNYVGLRTGDADFEGYISNGDINRNGLIDAYDISVVATQLDGGVKGRRSKTLEGTIELSTAKQTYNAGETVEITAKGKNLHAVNALSFALPYNSQDYEFVDIKALNMKEMENMSRDRLHTNGLKALYPTFVNIGDKALLEGDADLFVIVLKAKRKVKFDLKMEDRIIVDKWLNRK